MITSYEIKKQNNEEILYLIFDFNEQFGKFSFKEKKQELEQTIKEFINKNKINFKGYKVAIVISGIVIGTLFLNNDFDSNKSITLENNNINITENIENLPILNNSNDYIEESKEDEIIQIENQDKNQIIQEENINLENTSSKPIIQIENTQNQIENNQVSSSQNEKVEETKPVEIPTKKEENKTYVTIYRTNGTVITLELEEYIIGVVGAEMPASFNEQALMAQAVIARTYALKTLKNNKVLTDNSSTQNYKTNEELRNVWGSNYDFYYSKIQNAVSNTKGIYLTYNGQIIDAVYHSTSNGYTEDSKNVWGNSFPYLVSVESIYDSTNKNFLSQTYFTYEEISNKLQTIITKETNFNILSYTSGNRVESIEINGIIYTGVKLRSLLGLRSATFEIQKNDDGVIIITKGYGHGVGMSQYGANGMAKNGYSYEQILKHYYLGVTLNYS